MTLTTATTISATWTGSDPSDGVSASATASATVTVDVAPVGMPTALDDTYSTTVDTPLVVAALVRSPTTRTPTAAPCS